MTTAPNVSLYRCEDGTEFPIEWPSEEAPNHAWRWNEDHHPLPLKPLMAAIDYGRKPGGEKAYDEAGVAPPHMFREWITAQGFQYIRMSPLSPPELADFAARSEALAARHGGPCRVWEAYSLPRVREACEQLRALPAESPVEQAGFLFDYAFQLTQVAGPTVLFPALMSLTELLTHALGPEGALLAQEATQGGANDTIASDQAIWEMSQLAKANAAVATMLAGDEKNALGAIVSLPPGHPFRLAFEDYVNTYRWRAEEWDPGSTTVGEAPEKVLGLVERAMSAPPPLMTTRNIGETRREQAIARIEEALRGDAGRLNRFREMLAAFDGYVGVREGRALWQLTACGSLRCALLAKGEALVERGLLAEREDIFFLLPDEIDRGTAAGTIPYHDLAARRREEWEFWKTKRPPLSIGAAVPAGPQPFPIPIASTGPVLRGIAASRGVVTARVKVLRDLEEADEFEPGEVLVCTMTSPPWTPLFAIAAAVVTDSGAALSHPAIASREYGIPCVVGARDATRKLRTGMLVTVDGAAGTVTIERE